MRFEASIIIPVHNKIEYTQQCLLALSRSITNARYEVIVVDNASTDGTRELLQSLEGDVKIITNSVNQGFSKSNNQGVAMAEGEFIILLNNDTIPTHGWLREMIDTFSRRPDTGIVGAKLIYPDDESIQHAGLAFNGHSKIPYHIYRGFSRFHPAVNREREFQAVTAACLCVRKEIYSRAGGLDESFINGGEDVDFCLKLREMGHHVVYNPKVEIYHFESRTSGRGDNIEKNRRRLVSIWGDSIKADDFTYYREDGYIADRYVPSGNHEDASIEMFTPELRMDPEFIRNNVREILVVKPSGIGNMILFTPALQALRQLLPEARISMACYREDSWVISDQADHIIILEQRDEGTGLPDLSEMERKVVRNTYDLALYPPFTQIAGPNPYLKSVIPYHIQARSIDYHHRHEVEHNMDLIREMGWRGITPPLKVTPGRKSQDLEGKKVIGVHMGASGSDHGQRKKWPTERWRSLLQSLPEHYHIAFMGGPSEKDEAEAVSESLRTSRDGKCHVFAGRLNLRDSAAVISQCAAFVSNDSGMMHLASAEGTPVVGIFGPTLPSKNAPWGDDNKVRVVRKDLPCSPCYHDLQKLLSCNHMTCLESLTSEEVRTALFDMLDCLMDGDTDNREPDIAVSEWPRVAIHMAIYNRRKYLGQAIRSIVSQDYPHWELWISNDGGENISDIINKFDNGKIHLLNLPHKGKSSALNTGLERSQGQWIGYLDDDDIHYPFHLSVLMDAALKNPGREFLYSDTFKVYLREFENGNCYETDREVENVSSVDLEMILVRNYINHKNILHRRSLIDKTDGYDTGLTALIDWDMIRRLFCLTRPLRVPVITGEYYIYNREDGRAHQISSLWDRDPQSYTENRGRILSKPLQVADDILANIERMNLDICINRAKLRSRYELAVRKAQDAMEQSEWNSGLFFANKAAASLPIELQPQLLRGKCLVELGRIEEAVPFLIRGMNEIEGVASNTSEENRKELQKAYVFAALITVAYMKQKGLQDEALRTLKRLRTQGWITLSGKEECLVRRYEEAGQSMPDMTGNSLHVRVKAREQADMTLEKSVSV